VPVLTPLFVVSFRRADELALAMEARCYRPGIVRTRLHPLHAGAADAVLLAAAAAVIAAGLLV
jgi:energy-coupling factor transport system permease protein